jgi:segregation and condensation protein B
MSESRRGAGSPLDAGEEPENRDGGFDEISLLEEEFASESIAVEGRSSRHGAPGSGKTERASESDRQHTATPLAEPAQADPQADEEEHDPPRGGVPLAAGDGQTETEPGETEPGAECAPGEEGPALETTLEAILFAAATPLTISRLTRILAPWKRAELVAALASLGSSLECSGRGVRLVETGAGYQLRSAPECAAFVRRIDSALAPRLSRPTLETLAIIAYRQPATRGEIEAVRGVNCDAVLGALLARRLIQVVSRRQSPGRPAEYGTTLEFLELFSLRDLSDLPPLPDPAAFGDLIASDSFTEEAASDGAAAEDLEPGGDRLEADRGGPDPLWTGEAQRQGGPRTRDEGGSGQGSGDG